MDDDMFEILAHEVPGQHDYDGVLLPGHFTAYIMDRVRFKFDFHKDDVLLAAFPGSGTTWVQAILYLMEQQDDLEKGGYSYPIDTVVRFIDITRPGDIPEIDKLEAVTPPRFIKTHLHFRFMEDQVNNCNMKIIVVLRNPKDTLVSLYHCYRMNEIYGPFRGTWNQFFDMFKEDQLVYGNWFEYTLEWWRQRNQANILVIKYEDIHKMPSYVVHKIADFCGRVLTSEQATTLLEMTSFSFMVNNKNTNMGHIMAYNRKVSPFPRKGIIGDWKNMFTVAQNEWFDKIYKQKLNGSNLRFDFE